MSETPMIDELEIKIIRGLAEYNMNISEAARKLYLHKNTVDYHIGKVFKNTGLNMKNFYDLCRLLKMVDGENAGDCEVMRDENFSSL